MAGWIKLHRKIREKAFYRKSEYYHLWSELLFNAAYEEKEMIVNGITMLMKPGQFVTSRLKLSQETGIEQSKVERILNYFKTEQQIEHENLHSCRLISIINWYKYQIFEQQIEHGMNSWRTADEQLMNTTKNSKNTKKEKKEKTNTSVHGDAFQKFWAAYPRKVGKGDVEKWFHQNDPGEDLISSMLTAIESQKASEQWQRQIIPNPLTWLHQKRWGDELPHKETEDERYERIAEKMRNEKRH